MRYRWNNNQSEIEMWQNGNLPDCDDCNESMRQLSNTGWIHHLQRHLVASVLRHKVNADWRLGQKWFRRTLIDHDAAINRANWMWLTGVAIDARARKYGGRDYIKRRSKIANPTRLKCVKQKYSRGNKGMNVLGSDLQNCSSPGQALTGYTRSGSCVGVDADAGKHHVCLDLKRTPQFCSSTGQSWCRDKMRCHDSESSDCLPENWCVCQWAFADAVDAVGCDGIDNDALKCDATNANVLEAYDHSGEAKHKAAADCLRRKCTL